MPNPVPVKNVATASPIAIAVNGLTLSLKSISSFEAHNRSKDAMLRNLSFMFSTKASQAQRDAAKYMWYNIQNQVILGEDQATI